MGIIYTKLTRLHEYIHTGWIMSWQALVMQCICSEITMAAAESTHVCGFHRSSQVVALQGIKSVFLLQTLGEWHGRKSTNTLSFFSWSSMWGISVTSYDKNKDHLTILTWTLEASCDRSWWQKHRSKFCGKIQQIYLEKQYKIYMYLCPYGSY